MRDLHEVFADPQLAAREHDRRASSIRPIGALRVLGTPLKLSDTPASIRTPPPTLGQHTEAVLTGDLGFAAGEVAALRAKGVV